MEKYILKATENIPSDGAYLLGSHSGKIHFTNTVDKVISYWKNIWDARDNERFYNACFPSFKFKLEKI